MDKLKIDFLLSASETREPQFTPQQFKIEPPNKEKIMEIASFATEQGKGSMLYNRTSSKPNSLYQHIIQKKVEKVMKDSSDTLRFQPYQKKDEVSQPIVRTFCIFHIF